MTENTDIKLWHDDVRPPPEGWTWVKNNKDAKDFLIRHRAIAEMSMDHDLGADIHVTEGMTYEEIVMLRGVASETGLDLARWIAASPFTKLGRIDIERITVHSWNPYGARVMAEVLADAGYAVLLKPYELS